MIRKSPGFVGFWLDAHGEQIAKVDFREWIEIIRLYWLGVDLGLQSDPEQPSREVS